MKRDDVMRETVDHCNRVGELMMHAVHDIQMRAVRHDRSKFSPSEFDVFAEETPHLRSLTYGSDEYKAALERIHPTLMNHYYHNRHHPEHFAMADTGIAPDFEDRVKSGAAFNMMSLIDLIEMLADWKAATERNADGDLNTSIEYNQRRFGYDDAMKHRLRLTSKMLGWL